MADPLTARELDRGRGSSIVSSPNDDLDLNQRCFGRLGCRLFVHTAKQDRVALAARPGNGIHGPILVTYAPCRGSDRRLAARRSVVDLPLKIMPAGLANPFWLFEQAAKFARSRRDSLTHTTQENSHTASARLIRSPSDPVPAPDFARRSTWPSARSGRPTPIDRL